MASGHTFRVPRRQAHAHGPRDAGYRLPMLSAAFERKVVNFVAVDVVAQAGLLRRCDVALLVDRWQVGHPDAQQVLRDHDLGKVAVSNGQCDIEIHRHVESRPVTVDLVVVVERLASVRRLHHLCDTPGVLGQGANVEAVLLKYWCRASNPAKFCSPTASGTLSLPAKNDSPSRS